MGTTQFNCPHCSGQISYTLIPHKAQQHQGPGHIFEQSVSTLHEAGNPTITHNPKSFWQSDGITYSIAGAFAGGVVLAFGWYYSIDIGPVVAGAALVAGLGLHVLKLWLYRPARAAEPRATTTKIKIESWTDDNRHVLLDEISDERITIDDLRAVARAINDGCNFSRPALSKVISQAKYHRIKSEFERLNYCFTTPANQTILTPRCRAFLRKLSTLP